MSKHSITAGQTVRISDKLGVVGGGEVLAVDTLRVTVAQKYTHRHNGRVVESGFRRIAFALATHDFEIV